MLEKMDSFFEKRLDTYDTHMLTEIESAGEFYPFTARLLPGEPGAKVLDLGCGTGLELEFYYAVNPTARVTGIDLSSLMLEALRAKFPEKNLTLIRGSYFAVDLGEACFDAAVSVESLHHFTGEEKLSLYKRLRHALKPGGYLILTDYFAENDAEEIFYRQELLRLKREQGICDSDFYHYDTPLTTEHEMAVLREAGFSAVEIRNGWGATYTLKAIR